MLSGSLDAKVGQATTQSLHFRSREPALPEEEIAYPTLEEPIKIYRKQYYVIFFET